MRIYEDEGIDDRVDKAHSATCDVLGRRFECSCHCIHGQFSHDEPQERALTDGESGEDDGDSGRRYGVVTEKPPRQGSK